MKEICRCFTCVEAAERYHSEAMEKLVLAADAWWDAWAKEQRMTVWQNDPRPDSEAAFREEFGPDTDQDAVYQAVRDAESALVDAIRDAKRDTDNILTLKSVGAL